MKISLIGAVGLTLMLFLKPASADEAGFLKSIGGKWSGNGSVTTKIGSRPLNVTCRFDSKARGPSLVMEGQCRGLVVVRRAVSADIRANGTKYSGTYIGPSGRPSRLSGSRTANSINFIVHWSREINGDRTAQMTLERIGAKGLRLKTVDKDLKSGRLIVTSDIRLTR
ncbi:hypothetical protein [Pararhizobium sp. PWRC1-1]|uniref:hypothetical protein n=1 Tax=Pararhizobium sp. PWRC1-1 TaxID=2804566 RepID=UPI003CF95827